MVSLNVNSLVIAFGHRSRSGKDTAAAAILTARGREWHIKRYGFADALKQEINAAVDAFPAGQRSLRYLWDDNYYFVRMDGVMVQLKDYPWVKYEENPDMTDPLSPYGKQRYLQQWWGTEFRRSVDPDYWAKKVAKQIEKDKPEVALITDLRFPNEFEFCGENGETVRIDRPDLPPLTKDSHYSDTALASMPDERWSRIIRNDGPLEQFQEEAVRAFDTFMDFYEINPRGYGLV